MEGLLSSIFYMRWYANLHEPRSTSTPPPPEVSLEIPRTCEVVIVHTIAFAVSRAKSIIITLKEQVQLNAGKRKQFWTTFGSKCAQY